ncbi:MAG: PAS domain S-box protein [Reyranella sp.]|uniref:PAS domain S-box protein n=1 Tax=Reyranella sp. TaxID=1929291 RepID=UPI003D0E0CAF
MTNGANPLAPDGEDPQRLAQALSQSHAKLTLAEQSAGIGIWDTDLATDLCRATPIFFRLMGLPPSEGPFPNDKVRAVRHPEDAAKVVDGFRQALAEGRDHYEVEYRIVRPSDGQLRWIFGRGRVIRDGAGKPVRYSGVDIDITDRKQAEQQLRESEERFSKAFNAAAHPMSITTLREGRYVDINQAGLAASGLSREQVIGRTVRDLGFYNDPATAEIIRDRLTREGSLTDLETTLRGRRGPRTYLLSGTLVELKGEPCLLTSAVDITERKRAEEHIHLLMNELNHRANNLLMVIQAIARQTATTTDPRDFAERFTERLNGIAASNALLVSGNWRGVDVAQLVRSQVTPFAGDSGRIGLDGPAIRVKPQAAQAIGMALHELATNAAKHGALANDAGRIDIAWSVSSDGARTFRIVWSEREGPPVVAPTRTGFGRTVVERMITGTLGGCAVLQLMDSGAVWTFTCPSSSVLESDAG